MPRNRILDVQQCRDLARHPLAILDRDAFRSIDIYDHDRVLRVAVMLYADQLVPEVFHQRLQQPGQLG